MSLSPGQTAILRALGEGHEFRELTATTYRITYPDRTTRDCPASDYIALIKLGYIAWRPKRGEGMLSPIGHMALRALEQEAGG